MWKTTLFCLFLLISFSQSILAFDYKCIVPVKGAESGPVSHLLKLSDNIVLVSADKGLFFYDNTQGVVQKVPGPDTGKANAIQKLIDGNALVGADKGLFLYEKTRKAIKKLTTLDTGSISGFSKLSNDNLIIFARNGNFLFIAGKGIVKEAQNFRSVGNGEAVELPNGNFLVFIYDGVFHYDISNGDTSKIFNRDIEIEAFEILKNSGVLIEGARGWFFFDSATENFVIVPGFEKTKRLGTSFILDSQRTETGYVDAVQALDDGNALFIAEKGFFLFDRKSMAITKALGPKMGSIIKYNFLSHRGLIIEAENGLFFYNISKGVIMQVSGADLGKVIEVYEELNSRITIIAEKGVFSFNANIASVTAVPGDKIINADKVYKLTSHRKLIFGDNGTFLYDSSSVAVSKIKGPTVGLLRKGYKLLNGNVLIDSYDGIFLFDIIQTSIYQISGPYIGRLDHIHDLSDGRALIGANGDGVFLFNADKLSIVRVPGAHSGIVFGTQTLPDKRVLIFGGDIWLIFDKTKLNLQPVSLDGVDVDLDDDYYELSDGDLLIHTAKEWLLFSIDEGIVKNVPGIKAASITNFHELSDGRILILSENALLMTVGNYNNAVISLKNLSDINERLPENAAIQTKWTLCHSCASIAEKELQLFVTAKRINKEGIEHSLSKTAFFQFDGDCTSFSASVSFPKHGKWGLQVISKLGGKKEAVGKSIVVNIRRKSTGELVKEYWRFILLIASVVYISVFLILFFLSHWHSWAFIILSDKVWSKVGVWPFFVLRHWPIAQRWVMAPWFKEVRENTEPTALFLDLPVIGPDSLNSDASALLNELKTQKYMWLQGGAGMGKSVVFEAWKRAYFASDASNISEAVKRYGFILIMLQVREYNYLPAEAGNVKQWVIDAATRQLGRSGFHLEDQSLLEAFLKSGGIALAFDGMNEGDRNSAIDDFINAFSNVPLLLTSQTYSYKPFKMWRLPHDIKGYAKDLLCLWLGQDSGESLSNRLNDDNLYQYLHSGYDLRLVADLVEIDPERGQLPKDRIALYRSVLSHIKADNGMPLQLDGLRDLTWTMVLEKRRNIDKKAIEKLGKPFFKSILRSDVNIVRREGDAFWFRHDQMRSFLAATWLVEESPNVETMTKRLDNSPIWLCSRRDQEELWKFVSELMITRQDLQKLWRFAVEEPDRAYLQAALQKKAKDTGWSFQCEVGSFRVIHY